MEKAKKVPVILQMEAVECGAASLAMILAYHGNYVPLERLRIECGVSRDGVNARSIVQAAELHGLEVSAYSKDIDELSDITFPAVIHWRFNHFVVLCGRVKDCFIINDPAAGRLRASYEEFDKSFTGIVICFEKGPGFKKSAGKKSAFIKNCAAENKGALAFFSLLSLVLMLINITVPVFSQLFINSVLLSQSADTLNPIIFAMLVALALQTAAEMLRSEYLLRMKAKIALVSSARFMWKMISLPPEFFAQRYAGELAARQAANDYVAEIFCSRIVPVFVNLSMLIVYFTVLLRYSVSIGILGGAAALFNAALIYITSEARKGRTLRLQRDIGLYEGNVAAGIDMMETIMACGSEDGFFAKWAGYAARAANAKAELARTALFTDAAPAFISSVINGAVLCLGVYEILAGRLTVGSLVALQGVLSIFFSPVSELAESAEAAQRAAGQIERLEDTQRYSVREDAGTDTTPLSEIEIENLTFSYNPLGEPVVKNLSFTVPRGNQIAVTGGTGCGKSTVAKLIAGLYEPSGGLITFGGLTKERIDRNVFYSSVASVDQEIFMFEGTVMDNITMWDESVSYEDAVQAAKDACIHDDVISRPGGYSSPVLPGGKNFSGGQKQRIEIARALAKKPDILILDEATSALDSQTEARITKSIRNRGVTGIIIAHRLSAIRDCDEIIVLAGGEIAERGTHDTLKNAGGLYENLFSGASQ